MRKSSYQKLKEEVESLRKELIILSTEDSSMEAMGIKFKWKMIRDNQVRKEYYKGQKWPDQTPQL